MDRLARAAGEDPVAFRLRHIINAPREAAVLELAAEKAGWSKPVADGVFRGVAVHKSFGSYVAQVAEVRLDSNGRMKVERVVCAVDCGIAVTPDQVVSQMEGGLGYGLDAALRGRITLKDGRVGTVAVLRLPAASDHRHADRGDTHCAVFGETHRRG